MERIKDAKERANMIKFLRDFPWLWGILQSWHHTRVEIEVLTCSELSQEIINFSDRKTQFWIKWSQGINREFPAERVDNLTPEQGEHGLGNIIRVYMNCQLLAFYVEYAIVIVEGEDEKKKITIYRPPKSQKVWYL